uniref:Uncharacterized protein n=1 Tax=viral metagenome TaxID=1070528 RepID=A0A6C0AVG6_9ZZZZ|tara:strand:+ start:268 stop:861 length:594 start_codon:yes stop_codon:yes gene_type:complete
MSSTYSNQNDLLLQKCLDFYRKNNNLDTMLQIINGESKISLRIVDWFATNYAKKNYTLYDLQGSNGETKRFKVYMDYKLKLKAYSKRRFDPFCRWERITIPYKNDSHIQTTIGQLNFFKWALENRVIDYIEQNYDEIENDMNSRNSNSKKRDNTSQTTIEEKPSIVDKKTRKRREELSVLASKSIKKENVEIIVKFN